MATNADSQALLLQLLDPSNRADPYPAYDRIREHGPLQLPEMTLNVFSSYQDCDDVLRHPRFWTLVAAGVTPTDAGLLSGVSAGAMPQCEPRATLTAPIRR
jgi:cytochrome P450